MAVGGSLSYLLPSGPCGSTSEAQAGIPLISPASLALVRPVVNNNSCLVCFTLPVVCVHRINKCGRVSKVVQTTLLLVCTKREGDQDGINQ